MNDLLNNLKLILCCNIRTFIVAKSTGYCGYIVKILNLYIILLCDHLYYIFPVSIHYQLPTKVFISLTLVILESNKCSV